MLRLMRNFRPYEILRLYFQSALSMLNYLLYFQDCEVFLAKKIRFSKNNIWLSSFVLNFDSAISYPKSDYIYRLLNDGASTSYHPKGSFAMEDLGESSNH